MRTKWWGVTLSERLDGRGFGTPMDLEGLVSPTPSTSNKINYEIRKKTREGKLVLLINIPVNFPKTTSYTFGETRDTKYMANMQILTKLNITRLPQVQNGMRW